MEVGSSSLIDAARHSPDDIVAMQEGLDKMCEPFDNVLVAHARHVLL